MKRELYNTFVLSILAGIMIGFGGVIYLNILKRRGKINLDKGSGLSNEQVEGHNEIPMQQSIDKFTIQIALIMAAYMLAYILMMILGNLLPGMRSTIYGFNFLLGVLSATLVKTTLNLLKKKKIVKKEYINDDILLYNYFLGSTHSSSI